MSFSSSFTADNTFSSTYMPSDNTVSFVQIVGTTLNISNERSITNSNDTGIKGEVAWGHVTTLGITTYYLYLYVDTNTWVRRALATW